MVVFVVTCVAVVFADVFSENTITSDIETISRKVNVVTVSRLTRLAMGSPSTAVFVRYAAEGSLVGGLALGRQPRGVCATTYVWCLAAPRTAKAAVVAASG